MYQENVKDDDEEEEEELSLFERLYYFLFDDKKIEPSFEDKAKIIDKRLKETKNNIELDNDIIKYDIIDTNKEIAKTAAKLNREVLLHSLTPLFYIFILILRN